MGFMVKDFSFLAGAPALTFIICFGNERSILLRKPSRTRLGPPFSARRHQCLGTSSCGWHVGIRGRGLHRNHAVFCARRTPGHDHRRRACAVRYQPWLPHPLRPGMRKPESGVQVKAYFSKLAICISAFEK